MALPIRIPPALVPSPPKCCICVAVFNHIPRRHEVRHRALFAGLLAAVVAVFAAFATATDMRNGVHAAVFEPRQVARSKFGSMHMQ